MEENKCNEILIQSIIKNKKRELMCYLAGYSQQKQLLKVAVEKIQTNDGRVDLYDNFIKTLYHLCTLIREKEITVCKTTSRELECIREQIFETAVTLESYKYSRDNQLKHYLNEIVNFDIEQSCQTGIFSYHNTLNYITDIKEAHQTLAQKYLAKSYQKR